MNLFLITRTYRFFGAGAFGSAIVCARDAELAKEILVEFVKLDNSDRRWADSRDYKVRIIGDPTPEVLAGVLMIDKRMASAT